MIVGLDLSLRGSAACWMPAKWKGDTTKLEMGTFGYPLTKDATLSEIMDRYLAIANGIVEFVKLRTTRAIYVEDYAFSMRSSSTAVLHELGGVVKVMLYQATGMVPIPVSASTCRKTLLQKLPKKDLKKFTEQNIRRLKGEALYWDADQVDAFCVVNHGMMKEGGVPLSFLGE